MPTTAEAKIEMSAIRRASADATEEDDGYYENADAAREIAAPYATPNKGEETHKKKPFHSFGAAVQSLGPCQIHARYAKCVPEH